MTSCDRFENHCFKGGCNKVALYGYEVDLLRDHAGHWACGEHRAELEELLAGRQAANQAPAEETQGKLL